MSGANAASPPLVSVILPTFNRQRTIARAIRSILAQSYGNFELLVVDDGSTDDTRGTVMEIGDPRIRYIPMPRNQGASSARNEGLRQAKGEFIAFQDSDDEWLSDKLETQIAAAIDAGRKSVAVFHMKVVYGRDEARVFGPGRVCCVPILPETMTAHDFVQITHRRNLISPQTLLFSRDVLDAIGYFDTLLVNSVDWDFALRLVRHAQVIFIREPLVMTYIQDDSISTFKRNAARSQLRIVQKLRKQPDVDPKVLSTHLGRIGMALSRFGKPRSARRALSTAVALSPLNWRGWARLAYNELWNLLPRSGRNLTSRPSLQSAASRPRVQNSVA